MPDKNKHTVNVTSGALGAHDEIERPRSSMQDFLSSGNPYDRFAATGSRNHRGLGGERDTKRILTPFCTRDEKNTGSSSKSQKKDSGMKVTGSSSKSQKKDSGMKVTGSSSKNPEKDSGKKKGTKNK